jgi:predicted RNA-binding protein with TRAM domain
VEVEDIHESGAGVGRTEEGFIIMVDGVLPPTRARVEVTKVRSNHARAKELERLPDEKAEDEETEETERTEEEEAETETEDDSDQPHLGSRDNFWGN